MTIKTALADQDFSTKAKLDKVKLGFRTWWPRIKDLFVYGIAQVKTLQKTYPGIMHVLIFWGVTIQVIGTAINLMQMPLFIPGVVLTYPREGLYLFYELMMDLAGVAILLGVGMAAYRRIFMRPKALETRWDDIYGLVIFTLIPLVGFSTEGMRLLSAAPEWASWSFVGIWVSRLWQALGVTPERAAQIHPYFLWTHIFLVVTFVASIPFTKFRHLVAIPINIMLHPTRKMGTIEKIENIDEAEVLGVGKVEEFSGQQLLSFDACIRCGRCEDSCPASISGMDYSPRILVQTLRQSMLSDLVKVNGNGKSSPVQTELIGEAMVDNYPWSCTTCGACVEVCPAFVRPLDEVIDLRRYQALTTGKIPKPVADTLRNLERQGNPWGMPAQDRVNWASNLGVREIMPGEETDVLLFLGCAFAYDDRNKKVAQAFVRLLQKAGVDFAILGLDETCCGETARRMGNEYLFQVFAEQNIETLKQVTFNRLVTQCPHCFNTLKNEYPQMGGVFPVQHYTEFLSSLDLPGHLFSTNGDGVHGRLAYHDSCYLGRYNHIYEAPRKLLDQAHTQRVELKRVRENSFCCGGGGGQMWLETDPETRINHRRLAEAQSAQVEVVATACPYCMIMFDDAIRSKGVGDQIQVLDIAEILEKKLVGEKQVG